MKEKVVNPEEVVLKNKEQAPDRKAVKIECATCVCYDLQAKECRPDPHVWYNHEPNAWCREWRSASGGLGEYNWPMRLFTPVLRKKNPPNKAYIKKVERSNTLDVSGIGLTGRIFFEYVPSDRISRDVDRPIAAILREMGVREMNYMLEEAVYSTNGEKRQLFGLLRTQHQGAVTFHEFQKGSIFYGLMNGEAPVYVTFDLISLWRVRYFFLVEHELISRVGILFEYVDPVEWVATR